MKIKFKKLLDSIPSLKLLSELNIPKSLSFDIAVFLREARISIDSYIETVKKQKNEQDLKEIKEIEERDFEVKLEKIKLSDIRDENTKPSMFVTLDWSIER